MKTNNIYEVVTYITSMNDGKTLGSILFTSKSEAWEFASNFENLRQDALAFVNVVKGEDK